MALAAALSSATLLLSAVFAALVLRRWRDARRPHQLLWGVALMLFAAASALEVQAALQGWTEAGYKAYFVTTAVMVGWMAAGTGFLLSRGLGRGFAAFVLVVGEAMLLLLLFTPADAARLAAANAAGEVPTRVFPGLALLHPLVDVPAALLLIASPLLAWRRTRAPHTLLIAAGALAFTVIHSLASGAQTGAVALSGADLFSAGSLVGLVLLFAGYAKSREAPPPAASDPAAVVALG
ncbi:MAG TPA: hypothetical protein VGR28_06580 [Candidatus Thermoplasmatota archaeon]|nr:hypothetical protein [Candidatus Thermoplasmatota archaeon]